MVTPIAVSVMCLAALVTVVRPRLGLVLVWFGIYLYPNRVLYGSLPLNIRLDDLWLMLVAMYSFFAPDSRKVMTPALALSFLWAFCIILGEFAGMIATGMAHWEDQTKSAVKALYIPATAFALTTLLHRQRYLENHIFWLGLAGAAAGILGILTVYYPYELRHFIMEYKQEGFSKDTIEYLEQTEVMEARRGPGAVGVIPLSQILLNIGLLTLSMMIHHPRRSTRLYYGALATICTVALAYTSTRSAIAGFIAAVLVGLLVTHRRVAMIITTVVGGLALLLQGSVIRRVVLRILGRGHAYGDTLEESYLVRLGIFTKFFENFSVLYFFVGMGMVGAERSLKANAHNAYIGAFVYGGLLGVIVLVLVIWRGLNLGRLANRVTSDWLSIALGTYMLMLVAGMMVQGLAGENFQQVPAMQLYFAGLVFVERRLDQLGIPTTARPAEARPLLQPEPLVMPGPYVTGATYPSK